MGYVGCFVLSEVNQPTKIDQNNNQTKINQATKKTFFPSPLLSTMVLSAAALDLTNLPRLPWVTPRGILLHIFLPSLV